MRFSIPFSRVTRIVLGLLGMGPGRSLLRVDGPDLRIRLGWGFRAKIPLAVITSARTAGPPPLSSGVGVHGWQGSWVVNGRRGPTVVLELAEPVPSRIGPFTSGVTRLQLGVDDPEGFVEAVSAY